MIPSHKYTNSIKEILMYNNLDRHNLKDMAPVIAQHIEEEDGDPHAVTVVVFSKVVVI